MKILIAAAEVVPFAKTGGLADVAGALPKMLARQGHDVRVVLPRYGCINGQEMGLRRLTSPFAIPHAQATIDISIEQSDRIESVTSYFIRNDALFNRKALYGEKDDDIRFTVYCRGILEMCEKIGWIPDVIHCNDWHTALVPVYLKTAYAHRPEFAGIGTLFTIHNLAYQGSFDPSFMEIAGLPSELFTWDKLAFFGRFNCMKVALLYADVLSTVSEGYSKEIQTAAYGEGLERVLAYRKANLFGILNGLDYQLWNPASDPLIPSRYCADDLSGKRICKQRVQAEMGLPVCDTVPVYSMISRLSSQKGLDLLEEALPLLLNTEQMQLIVLGTGDACYEEMLQRLAARYPNKLAVCLRFNNALAHRIYAGSDAFLMPSRYEPCGLGQMIALAYGVLPVVRATGGLADTIVDCQTHDLMGNGFVFKEYRSAAFVEAVHAANRCYHYQPERWQHAISHAFQADFSWEKSSRQYVHIYEKAMTAAHQRASAWQPGG